MDEGSKEYELVVIRVLPGRSREIVFKRIKAQEMKNWL
jgi:hypothetical protein